MSSILIVQTAFIGDVILATALIEQAHRAFPDARISVLVRKGNEIFFVDHPFVEQTWVWDKKAAKYSELYGLIRKVRKSKFDAVITIQRFAAAGMITAFSGARFRVGFKSNPMSFAFTHRVIHSISNNKHEIERNAELLKPLAELDVVCRPKLYPTDRHQSRIKKLITTPFLTMSPQSVWFTKTAPAGFWVELIKAHKGRKIYLIGSPNDRLACDQLIESAKIEDVVNLCGELNLMESAALMGHAQMNFTNDSAPMHLCSAVNAPVTAVFCSTVPEFGFGPLSDAAKVLETTLELNCRPCGLHGHARCPQGHFKCGQLDVKPITIANA